MIERSHKTTEALLQAIAAKLDLLVYIQALQGKGEEEKIRILRERGFDWPTIGLCVGLTPDAARMRASRK